MRSKKAKHYSLRKTKKLIRKSLLRKKKNKKYSGGGIEDNIGNYYIYSSHNSEVLTSQVRGIAGNCIINDFISRGGSIELDFESVRGKDILISHSSIQKLLLSELFKNIVDSYYILTTQKTVNPLIINIDANQLGTCNTLEFFGIFHNVITNAFKLQGKYDEKRCQLRILPEVLNGKITPETDITLLKNKILLRWDYGGQEGCNDKHTFLYNPYLDAKFNVLPDLYLSAINMIKCKISPSIPINDSNNVDTISGKLDKKTIALSSKSILSRTFPKFRILKYNYNYDFALLMLVFGINFIALNLNIIDIHTCAYNEFFKNDTFVKIPRFITDKSTTPNTTQPIAMPRRRNSTMSANPNANQNTNAGYSSAASSSAASSRPDTPTSSSCSFGAISEEEDFELTPDERSSSYNLAEMIRNSISNVDDTNIENIVRPFIESCELNPRNAPFVYHLVFSNSDTGNAAKNFMEPPHTFSKNLPSLQNMNKKSAVLTSYVGGGSKYQVSNVLFYKISRFVSYSVSTTSDYEIYSIYNYFDIFGEDIKYYKHYADADMSIFNILCIKLHTKSKSQKYIACINLTGQDLTKQIQVNCYQKKDNYYAYTDTKCNPKILPILINITLSLVK